MRVILGQTLMACFHADAALAAGDPTRALEASAAALLLAERTGEAVMTPLLHLLRARASTGGGCGRASSRWPAPARPASMGQSHLLTLIGAVADVHDHGAVQTDTKEHRR